MHTTTPYYIIILFDGLNIKLPYLVVLLLLINDLVIFESDDASECKCSSRAN